MWTVRHITVSLEYFNFFESCDALTLDLVTDVNRHR